ncbi:MAG: endonuclease III [Gemmatimonadota bacterium]|nr:MAG: endonuclease III [Gemmatimonadota bacterium]
MKGAKVRIRQIIARLKKQYPEAQCSLTHRSPLQLLVATILSAQCTDERVNIVTKSLFRKYKTASDFANADPGVFEQEIKSTGFYRNKTRSIISMAQDLVEKHQGEVPQTMDEMVRLHGVGRKTANVVLGNAFGIDEGIVVDTHVKRISNRLALSGQKDPDKVEQELMQLVPKSDWTLWPHLLIHHGRAVCQARAPKCELCTINSLCPSRSS